MVDLTLCRIMLIQCDTESVSGKNFFFCGCIFSLFYKNGRIRKTARVKGQRIQDQDPPRARRLNTRSMQKTLLQLKRLPSPRF